MNWKYVLIVEDENDVANLMKDALEDGGFEAAVVSSGEAALDSISARKPGIVVLDIGLPAMDGYEVLERLKKNPDTSSIPVAVCSTKKGALEIRRTMDLGAVDYITKPFDPNDLSQRILRLVKKSP